MGNCLDNNRAYQEAAGNGHGHGQQFVNGTNGIKAMGQNHTPKNNPRYSKEPGVNTPTHMVSPNQIRIQDIHSSPKQKEGEFEKISLFEKT